MRAFVVFALLLVFSGGKVDARALRKKSLEKLTSLKPDPVAAYMTLMPDNDEEDPQAYLQCAKYSVQADFNKPKIGSRQTTMWVCLGFVAWEYKKVTMFWVNHARERLSCTTEITSAAPTQELTSITFTLQGGRGSRIVKIANSQAAALLQDLQIAACPTNKFCDIFGMGPAALIPASIQKIFQPLTGAFATCASFFSSPFLHTSMLSTHVDAFGISRDEGIVDDSEFQKKFEDPKNAYIAYNFLAFAAQCVHSLSSYNFAVGTHADCKRALAIIPFPDSSSVPFSYCDSRNSINCPIADGTATQCCTWSDVARQCMNSKKCPSKTTPPRDLSSLNEVRILVFGDSGVNGNMQQQVAYAMFQECAKLAANPVLADTYILSNKKLHIPAGMREAFHEGCHFGIVTGDNIYDKGPSGTRWDPQFHDKFESTYALFGEFPLLMTLGNHDYGNNARPQNDNYANIASQEIEYGTKCNKRWMEPFPYYRVSGLSKWPNNVGSNALPIFPSWLAVTSIDTNLHEGYEIDVTTLQASGPRLSHTEYYAKQEQALFSARPEQITANLVFGHAPPFSHGAHSKEVDSGVSEGISDELLTHDYAKLIVDWMRKYKIDVFLGGHDHSMEHTQVTASAAGQPDVQSDVFILGNAAKLPYELAMGSKPAHYEVKSNPVLAASWKLSPNSAHRSNGFGIITIKSTGNMNMKFYRVQPNQRLIETLLAYECDKLPGQNCIPTVKYRSLSSATYACAGKTSCSVVSN